MDSEILTLSQDEIENIKEELCSVLGYDYKDKIEANTDNFGFAYDKKEYIKKHKNLFIISNKEKKLLDLEIDLKELSSLTDMDYQIKFEGYRIKFTDSLSKEKIKIGQNLYFNNCDFKAIELKNICFKNFEIDRYRYESDQKKPIIFRACEFKELSLNNSVLSEEIRFEEKTKIKSLYVKSSEFKKYFWIYDCFIEEIDMFRNRFKSRCFFLDSKFGNKDYSDINKDFEDLSSRFISVCFDESVFCDESVFYESVIFEDGEFEKIVSFCGVRFDKTPIFSQSIFKGNLNVINTNLNFDFDDLKIQIKKEQDKKPLDNFANSFRDSFRTLKNALIKDNNLLDASNFHKYELYCKEIELENKKDKTLKDKIDKWQLLFYHKLCDHHTDLLLNLKWLVVLIGSFALLYFTSRVIQDINLLKVLNQYGVCLSMIGVFNLFCLYWFRCIKKFDFFVYFNLIAVLWVVCYKPKIIFGIVNLIGDNSYNGFENVLITIYTILLTLVLFSLQKTARKNSIVPS
ncbi:TPA: hypothetical protein R5Z08_001535 [Campylobacter coli]|nr:hypothetical protein [Campylobacter coli]